MKQTARLAALAALVALAGCTTTPAPVADGFNPPPGNCVGSRYRLLVDKTTGTVKSDPACYMWYFGPSREQDMRFRKAGGL